MKAVVLLSGGLDSTVCALLAGETFGLDQVAGLNIQYGQKHIKETESAKKLADRLGLAKLEIINFPEDLFRGSGSTLIDTDKEIPNEEYPETGPVSTYVPFRNGNLISIATAFALKVNAEAVYFGAHAEDAMNWAYPDCTPEFLGAMQNAVWVGTYHKVRLITPLEWLNKVNIVELGQKMKAPFELTWSCYQGKEEACGQCAACISRQKAFKSNGLTDPIKYQGAGI